MHHLVQIWFQWVEQWGYVGIILLMAMESSIFPVPSEIVIPPAAFLAMEGKLNTFGVIAAGAHGACVVGGAGHVGAPGVVCALLPAPGGPFFVSLAEIARGAKAGWCVADEAHAS